MKKILFASVLLGSLCTFYNAYADESKATVVEIPVPHQATVIECSYDGTITFEDGIMVQRRGCCSWHGGVAGCDESSGRLRCNDGTLSPSCRC